MARRTADRIAYLVAEFPGISPSAVEVELQRVLGRHLDATARFGYSEAQKEISRLRARQPVAAKYEIPDAGRYGRYARAGLSGVLMLVSERVKRTAYDVRAAADNAARNAVDPAMKATVAIAAGRQALHNHVLELIGETLNMGRTAGALEAPGGPPEFALRSEQLDKNTCDACTAEQGQIYRVDSDEYYAHLPPSFCYGGGRCRGIMVFGAQHDVSL